MFYNFGSLLIWVPSNAKNFVSFYSTDIASIARFYNYNQSEDFSIMEAPSSPSLDSIITMNTDNLGASNTTSIKTLMESIQYKDLQYGSLEVVRCYLFYNDTLRAWKRNQTNR